MAPPSRSVLTSRAADSIKGAGDLLLPPSSYVALAQAKDAIRSALHALEWVERNCSESKSAYPTRPDVREAILIGGERVTEEIKFLQSISFDLASIEHPENIPPDASRRLYASAARIRQITFVPAKKVVQ